jgi:hypothetical protein
MVDLLTPNSVAAERMDGSFVPGPRVRDSIRARMAAPIFSVRVGVASVTIAVPVQLERL